MNTMIKLIELKEDKKRQKENDAQWDILNEHIKAMGKALNEHKERMILNSIATFASTDVSNMFRNCTSLHQIDSPLTGRDNIRPKTLERI